MDIDMMVRDIRELKREVGELRAFRQWVETDLVSKIQEGVAARAMQTARLSRLSAEEIEELSRLSEEIEEGDAK